MAGTSAWISENYLMIFLVAAIISAACVYFFLAIPIVYALLVCLLFWCVGVQGIAIGVGEWYGPSSRKIAKQTGWPTDTPFQKEQAGAEFGFGVIGLLAFFFGGLFIVAVALGASIMLFSKGLDRLLEYRKYGKKCVCNKGTVMYFELLVPVLLIILTQLWLWGY